MDSQGAAGDGDVSDVLRGDERDGLDGAGLDALLQRGVRSGAVAAAFPGGTGDGHRGERRAAAQAACPTPTRRGRRCAWACQVALLATGASLGLAGHLGASITHGEDYLTEYAPNPVRRALGLPVHIDPADLPWKPLPERVVFAEVVAPVLTERCVGCHGGAKANGGLRLDAYPADPQRRQRRGGGRGG